MSVVRHLVAVIDMSSVINGFIPTPYRVPTSALTRLDQYAVPRSDVDIKMMITSRLSRHATVPPSSYRVNSFTIFDK